jgi:hypothetical protein
MAADLINRFKTAKTPAAYNPYHGFGLPIKKIGPLLSRTLTVLPEAGWSLFVHNWPIGVHHVKKLLNLDFCVACPILLKF